MTAEKEKGERKKGMGRRKQVAGDVMNRMQVKLPALSVNEGMARATVAAFISQLDPSVTELADIKCAVSEAVTNCIVHGYRDAAETGMITLVVTLYAGRQVKIEIRDKGCGISDVRQARQPLFTTDAAGERSGMGFTVMESFTDSLRVISKVGKGTTVVMVRRLAERGRF